MRINVIFILVSLVACREVEDPVKIGYDYFPIAVENEWVYQVDSVSFDDDFSNKSDTFRYYRKEVVVEQAVPAESERFYVDVSLKTDSTDWVYSHTMLMYKNDIRAVRSTNNKPVVHLLFPVKDRVFWDANQLNTEREDRFRYINTHKDLSVLKDSFVNNIFVQQAFDTTIIDEDIRWELYSEDVGLVEKQFTYVEKQQGKRKGYDVHWGLTSHAKK